MAGERTDPLLPCADIDAAEAFYTALGFTRTYRQVRPHPYIVMQRDDLAIHLFGMDGFDPEQSYGSVLVVSPDPDALYEAFAAGLRRAYGRLPVTGIPRITRPRRRYGTVRGFSVVDVGGNWLRVSRAGDSEPDEGEGTTPGLTGVVEVAARLGDAKGDAALALRTLDSGLRRFPDAAPLERAQALPYRGELAVRTGDLALAAASLADMRALELFGRGPRGDRGRGGASARARRGGLSRPRRARAQGRPKSASSPNRHATAISASSTRPSIAPIRRATGGPGRDQEVGNATLRHHPRGSPRGRRSHRPGGIRCRAERPARRGVHPDQ